MGFGMRVLGAEFGRLLLENVPSAVRPSRGRWPTSSPDAPPCRARGTRNTGIKTGACKRCSRNPIKAKLHDLDRKRLGRGMSESHPASGLQAITRSFFLGPCGV